MRVLHLPVNVASHMSATIGGLRNAGVDARGIATIGASVFHSNDHVEVYSSVASRRQLAWWRDIVPKLPKLAAEIRAADVLHWYMVPVLPGGLDLRFIASFAKPSIVEFAGSEIRDPAIEAATNPAYAAIWDRYEYRSMESSAGSTKRQQAFADAGFEALISCPSQWEFLRPGMFGETHLVRQRVLIENYTPLYPDPNCRRPVVVHSASAPVAKGTSDVRAAAARLSQTLDFELVVLERVSREEAVRAVKRCDIFLDQFVLGSHGSAAIEAMALGKPVVGWVKPTMEGKYPADFPMLSGRGDNLDRVLAELIVDGTKRAELGRLSRRYAEEHHDASRLAAQLIEVYEGAIRRRGAARSA